MADPAGLIALGIESCKLILKFCDGWRNFDDDLDNIKIKAEGLLSTLKLIGSLLSQNTAIQPAIAAEITTKVLENEKWINKINERVTKWSVVTQAAGFGDKVRATGKKLTYPFRKDALLDTVKILEGLQMNLHTALLALQVQQASTLAQQTQLIQTVQSIGSTTLTTLQRYETSFNKMELALHSPSPVAQAPFAAERLPRSYADGIMREQCGCPGLSGQNAVHRRSCRLGSRPSRKEVQTRRLKLSSQWLGISVEFIISVTKAAGRLTISPTLHYHPIVTYDSPAFSILRRIKPHINKPAELSHSIDLVIQDLGRIFDSGKASPFDRTLDGFTLMHAACVAVFGCRSPSEYSTIDGLRLIKYLAKVGCPLNEPCHVSEFSPVDYLLAFAEESDNGYVISRFIELGGAITDNDLRRWADSMYIKDAFEKSEEGFIVSDLVYAILSRSSETLAQVLGPQQILKGDKPAHIEDDTSFILCLSMSWPDGFRRILKNNTDIQVEQKENLLNIAISWNYDDAAEALLEIGAPLSARNINRGNSQEVECLLLRTFIARRKRLQTLAKSTLPKAVYLELGLESERLPDDTAAGIYHALQVQCAGVDHSLDPGKGIPLFHNNYLTVSQMDALYNAGFTGIDVLDYDGCSPILRMPFYRIRGVDSITRAIIGRITWLTSKGATAYDNFKNVQETYTHFLAAILLDAVAKDTKYSNTSHERYIVHDIHGIFSDHQSMFEQVFANQCRDACSCFCSVAGCTPMIAGLRHLFIVCRANCFEYKINPSRVKVLAFILQQLIELLRPGQEAATDILRLITFHDLALTHTCCHVVEDQVPPRVVNFDDEDGQEIHEEEHELIEEFETLVEELSHEFRELKLPLWDYIRGHWCERVRKHLLAVRETVTTDQLCVRLAHNVMEFS
ncbi:hypothetical protein BJX64DRAFT_288358 [Aspergillus heterothallicus]